MKDGYKKELTFDVNGKDIKGEILQQDNKTMTIKVALKDRKYIRKNQLIGATLLGKKTYFITSTPEPTYNT